MPKLELTVNTWGRADNVPNFEFHGQSGYFTWHDAGYRQLSLDTELYRNAPAGELALAYLTRIEATGTATLANGERLPVTSVSV